MDINKIDFNEVLSSECKQFIAKMIKNYIERIENEYHAEFDEQQIENERLKKRVYELEIELQSRICFDKNKKCENVKKILDNMKEVENEILDVANRTPSWGNKSWHCREVRKTSIDHIKDNDINQLIISSPMSVRRIFFELVGRVDRLERELAAYDTHLNRWAEEIIIGKYPETQILGINFYDCPKGGRCTMPFVQKLVESTKPKELKTEEELKSQEKMVLSMKYPKVRL